VLLAFGIGLRPHLIHAFLHLFDAFLHFRLMCLTLLIHLLAAFLLLTQELLACQATTAGVVRKTAWHTWWIRTCPTFHPCVRAKLGRCRRCGRRTR
jgi:hypothetical protein